jgi:XapX domain-containing protein
MKAYIFSLGAGVLVGMIYSLLNVRSPAPPVIALIGLLGILIGEQLIPFAKTFVAQEVAVASRFNQRKSHIFGQLPEGEGEAARHGDEGRKS